MNECVFVQNQPFTNIHAGNQRLVQQSDHVRYDHTFNEIATSQISCLRDLFTS